MFNILISKKKKSHSFIHLFRQASEEPYEEKEKKVDVKLKTTIYLLQIYKPFDQHSKKKTNQWTLCVFNCCKLLLKIKEETTIMTKDRNCTIC